MHRLSRAIEEILPLVTKPSRYLGNEFHAVRKDPSAVDVQWLLVLPEVYEIGMSHWGLKILYEVLNRRPDALAERAYSPWVDMEERMRRGAIPLFSLESRRPARDFDVIGFSLQYEMTATNILTCLDLAGIPLWTRDRGAGDPLVIGGGPCASNPEPLADFFDAFLIGDGEEAVGRITEVASATKGMPRPDRWKALATIPGVYVPALYEPRYGEDGRFAGLEPVCAEAPRRVRRTFLPDLEDAPYPETPVVPVQEVVQDRLSIEILRGCTQGCRFCQAGYLYRPVRERSPRRILQIAERGLEASGWDTIGLVSLSTTDYSRIDPLVEALNSRYAGGKVSISLPSLRADRFGIEIAEKVREVKRTGFTFAPEAGSERLRRVINKRIGDAEFLEAARIAYGRGWRLIKLYMMIGLPTEEWEDIEGAVRFAREILSIARAHGPSCKLNLSVGAFVPKSHTPFQWEAFEDVASLRRKIDHLRSVLSSRSARVKWNDLETSHIEAVLSRGDRRVGKAIHRAWEMGARFDGWSEHFSYERWLRAFEETGCEPSSYTRRLEVTDPLPWDHIDIGILRKYLVRERGRALAEEPTGDCRRDGCMACGIPGMPDDIRLAPEAPREAAAEARDSASRADAPAAVAAAEVLRPVRVRFAKEGPARFLSHLETGTIFARALRIAGIPIGFSHGHSPHPKFHFGPPLPVGIAGLSELMEMELLVPWQDEMIDRLNGVVPGGFRVIEGRPLPAVAGVRRISLALEAALGSYEADLSAMGQAERDAVGHSLERFAAAPEWIVRRGRGEDDTRVVDLKRACSGVWWDPGSGVLKMVLRLIDAQGHTANPGRVLAGVLDLDAEAQARCFVTRTALLREDGVRL